MPHLDFDNTDHATPNHASLQGPQACASPQEARAGAQQQRAPYVAPALVYFGHFAQVTLQISGGAVDCAANPNAPECAAE